MSVQFKNTGNAPVTITAWSITGDNNDFPYGPITNSGGCVPSIAPGAICTFFIRFIPQSTGVKAALLNIPSNASNSPAQVPMFGTGVLACTTTLTPTSASVPATAGSGFPLPSVSTTCITNGQHTAQRNVSWIHLTGENGSGSVTTPSLSSVTYSVDSNPSSTPRTGTITVDGKQFTVNQAGNTSTPCTYALNPTSASIPAAGGSSFSVAVTQNNSPSGCSPAFSFDARSNTPWIQLMGPANSDGSVTYFNPSFGSGSSVKVLYKVNSNLYPTSDTGTITIAGRTFTVKQQGTGAGGPAVTVIEYYNASLDHYFITWIPAKIGLLDGGTQIKGWVRTGQSFKAYTIAQAGTSPVCRFYIPPRLGDSHFFGRGTAECNSTGQKNPSFVLEDPAFMHVFLPNLGVCPAGTIAIYRVFSNRPDANHRYMTDPSIRDQMVAIRWLAEGDGPNLVVMCAPQ